MNLNRRKLLELVSSLAVSSKHLVKEFQSSTKKRVAVFLPGAMGSVLQSGAGAIWSKDATRIYRTLVDNPNLLRYTGKPLDAVDVLDYVQFTVGRIHYYTKLLDLLKEHPDFKLQNGLCLFPFDWRQDVKDILAQLRDKLKTRYGLSYDGTGKAIKHPEYEFDILGHSLGGVVVFLAVYYQIIHPDNIRTLTLLGAALMGTPKPFRCLFDECDVPLLEGSMSFWWGKNKELAMKNLRGVVQSFPSLYQMMPPESEDYIYDDGIARWTNPFKQDVLDQDKVKAGRQVHNVIQQSFGNFPIPSNRVHIIHVTNLETEADYFVRIAGSKRTYEFIEPVVSRSNGDGTVSSRSALYDDRARRVANADPFLSVEHATMCNNRRVLELLKNLLW